MNPNAIGMDDYRLPSAQGVYQPRGRTYSIGSSTIYPASSIYDEAISHRYIGDSISSGQDIAQFSAESYFKNYKEKFDANIVCATADDIVEKWIVQLLENNGVRCYYPPRDSLESVTDKESVGFALTFPVTLVPVNSNWGLSDEDLTDLILKEKTVDLKRYIVIKVDDGAVIPAIFRHVDVVDFTKGGTQNLKELEKLVAITKERVENYSVVKDQTRDKSEMKTNMTDPVADKPSNENTDGRTTFVPVQMNEEETSTLFGPQICSRYKESIDKRYQELNLKSRARHGMVHLNEVVKGLPKNSQDRRTIEEFLLGRVIPELRLKRNCLMLAEISGLFTTKVQTEALEALLGCTNISIIDFDDLLSLESVISESLQSISRTIVLTLLAQIYTNVICSMLLFYATNKEPGHKQSLVCNQNNRCLQKWPMPDKPSLQMTLNYCKDVITKAREMIERIKQGNVMGKVDLFRRHNANILESICSYRDAILDEGSCEQDFEVHVRTIVDASWFEQLLALKFTASMILTNDETGVRRRALRILQRTVYEMRKQTSKKFLFHVSPLLISILQSSSDEEFCKDVVHGLGQNTLGLRKMWTSMKILTDKRFKDIAVEYMEKAIRPLIHHQCAVVRMHVTRRLFIKRNDESESLEVTHAHGVFKDSIKNAYACQGLSDTTRKSEPGKFNQNPKFWTWTTTMGGDPVKVYTLTPNSAKDFTEGFDKNSTSMKDFLRELQIMLKVAGHINIVRIIGFQMQPTPYFIITEAWCENVSEFLSRRLRDHPMSINHLIRILLKPMLTAVAYCHDNGIILRDIVCTNFSIHNNGIGKMQVKYHNFRLAKSVKKGKQTMPESEEDIYQDIENIFDETVKGCSSDPIPIRYSAPESILHYKYSTKSDSWMCSCTAYEVLTHGCQPYTELYGMSTREVVQRVLLGYRVKQPPSIPDNLHILVMGGFIAQPSRRNTVQDFIDCLRDFQESWPTPDSCDLTQLMAYTSPQRDNDQPLQPERGILDHVDLEREDKLSMTYLSDEIVRSYPCTPSEIRGPDEPTLTKDGKYFVEYVDNDRCVEDNEDLQSLCNENVAEIVDIEQNGSYITQKTKFHGGLNLLQVCQFKLCDVNGILRCLEQVAIGMCTAHSEGWIHGCLKAKHIYINEGVAKIYRWGRAIRPKVGLYDEGPFQAVQLQDMPEDITRWAPPEILLSRMFSQPGDVFMFSQLCWEAFNALSTDSTQLEEFLVPYPYQRSNEVKESLCKKERQRKPRECPDWLYKLMKKMWHSEKSMRPQFYAIVQCFKVQSVKPVSEEDEIYHRPLQRMKRSHVAHIRKELMLDEEYHEKYVNYSEDPYISLKADSQAMDVTSSTSQQPRPPIDINIPPRLANHQMINYHCCNITDCVICANQKVLQEHPPRGAILKSYVSHHRRDTEQEAAEPKQEPTVHAGKTTDPCVDVGCQVSLKPATTQTPRKKNKTQNSVRHRTKTRKDTKKPMITISAETPHELQNMATPYSGLTISDTDSPRKKTVVVGRPYIREVHDSTDEFENPGQTTDEDKEEGIVLHV